MKPLSGIKVLEFCQVLSGPFCGMLMADLGADVIKLERPRWEILPATMPPAETAFLPATLIATRARKAF